MRKFRNKSSCWLTPDLIESKAFLSLSGKAAMLCVIRFHQKAFKKKNKRKRGGSKELIITNNGEIVFTYGEAKELGIRSSRTFYKVIRELVEEKGFVDLEEYGSWYGKQPNKFSISYRWRKYGTAEYEKKEIPRILPSGIGFQKKQNTLYQSKRTSFTRINERPKRKKSFVYQNKRINFSRNFNKAL